MLSANSSRSPASAAMKRMLLVMPAALFPYRPPACRVTVTV